MKMSLSREETQSALVASYKYKVLKCIYDLEEIVYQYSKTSTEHVKFVILAIQLAEEMNRHVFKVPKEYKKYIKDLNKNFFPHIFSSLYTDKEQLGPHLNEIIMPLHEYLIDIADNSIDEMMRCEALVLRFEEKSKKLNEKKTTKNSPIK